MKIDCLAEGAEVNHCWNQKLQVKDKAFKMVTMYVGVRQKKDWNPEVPPPAFCLMRTSVDVSSWRSQQGKSTARENRCPNVYLGDPTCQPWKAHTEVYAFCFKQNFRRIKKEIRVVRVQKLLDYSRDPF